MSEPQRHEGAHTPSMQNPLKCYWCGQPMTTPILQITNKPELRISKLEDDTETSNNVSEYWGGES